MNSEKEPPASLDVTERVDPPPSKINDSIVVLTSIGAGLLALLFAVTLLRNDPIQAYGGALAGALLLFAAALRRYFSGRYPDVTAVELREPHDAEADAQPDLPLSDVAPVGPRRTFLSRALLAAAGLLGLSMLAPVASLGPSPGNVLRQTRWGPRVRLVDSADQPVRAEEVALGGISTIWPQGAVGHERSAVLLVRLQAPAEPPTVGEWVVDGLVAYSKVCTHAGCPVALYRERDNALFCPCHQSTFDPSHGARPTFGPAARALPQLPLGVDDEGYLIALDDFQAQVGPALPRG